MMTRRPGFAATLILAAMALLVLVVNFKGAVRDNIIPRNFGIVDEGRLYRAGRLSSTAFRNLHEQYGFKAVIDFGAYGPTTRSDRRKQRMAESVGIPRYRLNLGGDATGNPNAYAQALRIMTDPELQPVLIYCGGGSERTSCAVVFYLHIMHGTPFEEGLAGAQEFKHRPWRNPNLRAMVETWGEAIIESYRTGGPISDVKPLPELVPVSTTGDEQRR